MPSFLTPLYRPGADRELLGLQRRQRMVERAPLRYRATVKVTVEPEPEPVPVKKKRLPKLDAPRRVARLTLRIVSVEGAVWGMNAGALAELFDPAEIVGLGMPRKVGSAFFYISGFAESLIVSTAVDEFVVWPTPNVGDEICNGVDRAADGRFWIYTASFSDTNLRVYYADEVGDAWTLAATFPDYDSGGSDIKCHPTDSDRIAIVYGKGVGPDKLRLVTSTNQGASWSSGLDLDSAADIENPRANLHWLSGGRLVVVYQDYFDEYRVRAGYSDDDGVTDAGWQTVAGSGTSGSTIRFLIQSVRGSSDSLFIGMSNDGMGETADLAARSVDDGETWELFELPVADVINQQLNSIAFSAAQETLYLLFDDDQLWKLPRARTVDAVGWTAGLAAVDVPVGLDVNTGGFFNPAMAAS